MRGALVVVLALLTTTVLFTGETVIGSAGIQLNLIHRESPLSPYYNHSQTSTDRFLNLVSQSKSRANHIHRHLTSSTTTKSSNNHPKSLGTTTIESQLISDHAGSYLMRFSVGTPPREILAIADTGSDLIWIQCEPCKLCYPQDKPIFDPRKSSSYRSLSCQSKLCKSLIHDGDPVNAHCLPGHRSSSTSTSCAYSVSYLDESFTKGSLAEEKFTFNSYNSHHHRPHVPKIVFGCSDDNNGVFNSLSSGLVGLGSGRLSLVSQLGDKIHRRFSYCLLPFSENSTSWLILGGSSNTTRVDKKVTTPLVPKETSTHYYHITMEGITVISDKGVEINIPITSNTSDVEGNMIIDSGTTLTLLTDDLYKELESAVRDTVHGNPTTITNNLDHILCYNTINNNDVKLPKIVFHFKGGADLHLPEANTFIQPTSDLICLAIVPTQGGGDVSILGNVAQANFKVVYDLAEMKLSFAPYNCKKH